MTNRRDIAARPPLPMVRVEAEKCVRRTLFAEKPPHPFTVLRSGEPLDVAYDSHLLVTSGEVELHLPVAAESRPILERALDALPGQVSFARAGIGFGLAGWASLLALAQNSTRASAFGPGQLSRMERKRPAMGVDWDVCLGARWRTGQDQEVLLASLERGRTVRRGPGYCRIQVSPPANPADRRGAGPSQRLASDLKQVETRLIAMARRKHR